MKSRMNGSILAGLAIPGVLALALALQSTRPRSQQPKAPPNPAAQRAEMIQLLRSIDGQLREQGQLRVGEAQTTQDLLHSLDRRLEVLEKAARRAPAKQG